MKVCIDIVEKCSFLNSTIKRIRKRRSYSVVFVDHIGRIQSVPYDLVNFKIVSVASYCNIIG